MVRAIGPGVIASRRFHRQRGVFLLGPAAFVKYGLALLWVVGRRRSAANSAQR
jgi:hypothetical protein